MHTLLSGMGMWMCMVGQLSPKGRFKPYYGEWLTYTNQLEREYIAKFWINAFHMIAHSIWEACSHLVRLHKSLRERLVS